MTHLTISEQVEQHYPDQRAQSARIAALEEKINTKKALRSRIYERARDESSRIDIEIGSINRQIKLEEALIRRKIARAIEAGRSPASRITRTNHNPVTKAIMEAANENHQGSERVLPCPPEGPQESDQS